MLKFCPQQPTTKGQAVNIISLSSCLSSIQGEDTFCQNDVFCFRCMVRVWIEVVNGFAPGSTSPLPAF